MYIFVITSVIYTIGAISFLFLASAETLNWAKNAKENHQDQVETAVLKD